MPLSPPVPDHGYAWAILVAATLIMTLIDGIPYTYGIVLVEVSRHFQVSLTTASLVGSVIRGATFFAGPLACGLNNAYGSRAVALGGSLMMAFGAMAGPFMPNIAMFIGTFGVLVGTGGGLMFVSAVVTVNQWFVKKRPLASGIHFSGSCYGVIAFPPLFYYLLETYGWKYVLWTSGALASLGVALSTTFRPMKIVIENDMMSVCSENRRPSILDFFPDCDSEDGCSSEINRKQSISLKPSGKESVMDPEKRRKSSIAILRPVGTIDALYTGTPRNRTTSLSTSAHERLESRRKRTVSVGPTMDLIHEDETPTMDLIHEDDTVKTVALIQDGSEKKVVEVSSSALTVVKNILDIKFLKNPVMILIALVQFLFFLLLQVPYMYLPIYLSEEIGFTNDKSVMMVPILGISNLFGRLFSGVIASTCGEFVSVFALISASFTILSATFFLLPLATTITQFVILATVQGIFLGPLTALTPEMLCQTFGLDKLTSTLGICCVFRGFGALLGPPLVGHICHYDKDNFALGFTAAGGIMSVTALMNVATHLTIIARKKRNSKDSELKPNNSN